MTYHDAALATLAQLQTKPLASFAATAHPPDRIRAVSDFLQQLAGDATLLFYLTEEAQEGRNAYQERRRPDFAQFPKRP